MTKFDVIVGNPPYQKAITNKKSLRIWDKFLFLYFDILKEDGYLAVIHPGGWRNVAGRLTNVKNLLLSKQINYLEIHDENDSVPVFGIQSSYDWYILQNKPTDDKTILKDLKGNYHTIDLKSKQYVPNFLIDLNYSMLSNDNIEIISDSYYYILRDHMSNVKTDRHIYPIVYTVNKINPIIWYSSKNERHFGIPKLIFNPNRPVSYLMDKNGEYGMSEFCIGIIGDDEYLDLVERVFKNQKINGFSEFMESTHYTTKVFNTPLFALYNKNLWKFFDEKTK